MKIQLKCQDYRQEKCLPSVKLALQVNVTSVPTITSGFTGKNDSISGECAVFAKSLMKENFQFHKES